MKKKTILLLGGSGFLGSRLISHLGSYHIVAPSHSDLDLVNWANIYKTIEKSMPDIIIYSAGVTRIDHAELKKELAITLNAKTPEKIAKFVSSQNTPFIYISTDAVFDGYKTKYIFSETDTPHPLSMYGISKLKGEEGVLSNNPHATVIRLISLFGIDSIRPNFLTKIFNDLKNGREVSGITDQVQNPLCVDIAAQGVSYIVTNQLQGIYHLGSLDWETNFDFTFAFANKFHLDSSLITKIPFDEFTKNKSAHRKKQSVLLSEKFNQISQNKILKTIDESFDFLYSVNEGK